VGLSSCFCKYTFFILTIHTAATDDAWIGSAFFFTQYEVKDTAKPYWFFKADIMDGVRTLFRRFGIRIPHYDTEERTLDVLIKPKHPPVTGYRIIVTAAAISFGMTKAMLSYRGQQTAPTTVEWAYGVVVTVMCVVL
jgi:hypothetical protein